MTKRLLQSPLLTNWGPSIDFSYALSNLEKLILSPVGNISYALPPEISLGTAVISENPL